MRVTSDQKINRNNNDVYSSKYYNYTLEVLRTDGTKDYITSSEIECLDYYTSLITFKGIGRYCSANDDSATLRIRIYDNNEDEYVYSDPFTVSLGAYEGIKTVSIGTGSVEYSNIEELQAGVSNQQIRYNVTATGLDESQRYGTSIVSVIECDETGAALEDSERSFTATVNWGGCTPETTDGEYYTVFYVIELNNKKALDAGYYYFKVKVGDVESLPTVIVAK